MPILNRRHSSRYKKSQSQKLYLPSNSRENQYFLLEIPTSVISKDINHLGLIELKNRFFECCKEYGIRNGLFVANDKLVKVRYGEENNVLMTNMQCLVSYSPTQYFGFHSYIEPDVKVSKIAFVVLASGNDIRSQAVNLHSKVTAMLADFASEIEVAVELFKLRDFQHITYDLFAPEKGHKKTVTHGFRSVITRYNQQGLIIPKEHKSHHFVVVKVPIGIELANKFEQSQIGFEYTSLYKQLSKSIKNALEAQSLHQAALVANGKQPFVSINDEEFELESDEIVKLGFDSNVKDQRYLCLFDSKVLVDYIHIVVSATSDDDFQSSYAPFVKRVHNAILSLTEVLHIEPSRDVITCRFFQHLKYSLPTDLTNV